METKRKVLYEALLQSIEPFKSAILDNFDDIYKVSQEDKLSDKDCTYSLSDYLSFASDIAFEVEQDEAA